MDSGNPMTLPPWRSCDICLTRRGRIHPRDYINRSAQAVCKKGVSRRIRRGQSAGYLANVVTKPASEVIRDHLYLRRSNTVHGEAVDKDSVEDDTTCRAAHIHRAVFRLYCVLEILVGRDDGLVLPV